MRRRRELPDTKIVPFPDNWRGDASPGAHHATWGPDHYVPPMRASDVVLVERGDLIATFTLHIVLKRGLGFYLRKCRLVRWGDGERAFPPNHSFTVRKFTAPDDDEEPTVIRPRTYYTELFEFDTNRGAKAFEEAMLAAARYAVAQHRADQREPSTASADAGAASDNDVVPF